jgi:hypothetical protein
VLAFRAALAVDWSVSSAVMIFGRVSRGMITSSM